MSPPKFSSEKREKKEKIKQIWRRVTHRTHENGVDNTTNSLDRTRSVLLLERTNAWTREKRMNEWTNEWSGVRLFNRPFFLSFSVRERARERARESQYRISRHLHPTWKTSSISGFLFHRARARLKENDTREKHEKNKNNATTTHRTLTLLLETTFKRTDCATADWVTENIICVWVFKWCQFMARYLCFFLSFRRKPARLCCLMRSFPRRERICLFSRAETLSWSVSSAFLSFPSLYFFFAVKKQAEQLFKFCFFVCLLLFFFCALVAKVTPSSSSSS